MFIKISFLPVVVRLLLIVRFAVLCVHACEILDKCVLFLFLLLLIFITHAFMKNICLLLDFFLFIYFFYNSCRISIPDSSVYPFSLCVCVCTHAYAHMRACACVHACMYVHACACVCVCACVLLL